MRIAVLEAQSKGLGSLRGRPVREGVRHHFASCRHLQPVITNSCGRVHGFVEVSFLDHVLRVLGLSRPNSGQTVCLQLDLYRLAVSSRLAQVRCLLVEGAGDAEEVLHVVAHLVGDDVGLGEIPLRAERARLW